MNNNQTLGVCTLYWWFIWLVSFFKLAARASDVINNFRFIAKGGAINFWGRDVLFEYAVNNTTYNLDVLQLDDLDRISML